MSDLYTKKYFLNLLNLNQIWIVINLKKLITIQIWFNSTRFILYFFNYRFSCFQVSLHSEIWVSVDFQIEWSKKNLSLSICREPKLNFCFSRVWRYRTFYWWYIYIIEIYPYISELLFKSKDFLINCWTPVFLPNVFFFSSLELSTSFLFILISVSWKIKMEIQYGETGVSRHHGGARLRAPRKPLWPSRQYGIEGFKGALSIVPPIMQRGVWIFSHKSGWI